MFGFGLRFILSFILIVLVDCYWFTPLFGIWIFGCGSVVLVDFGVYGLCCLLVFVCLLISSGVGDLCIACVFSVWCFECFGSLCLVI